MIQSTSNSHGSDRTASIAPPTGSSVAPKAPRADDGDSLSTPNAEILRQALESTPEVRPDVVENGKKLAVDPNYPPREIIEQLARLFNQSIDLTESV